MKKTSKIIVAVFALVSVMLLMVACSNDTPTTGDTVTLEGTTWVISGGKTADGQEVTGDDVNAIFGEITYSFEADGKLVSSALGVESEGTYTQDGNSVTITAAGVSQTGTIDGDQMTFESEGNTVAFTKK